MRRLFWVFFIILVFGGIWQEIRKEKTIVVPEKKILEVWDGENFFSGSSSAQTIGEFLAQEKIILQPEDLLYPEANSPLRFGQKIKILRPQTIEIEVDNQIKQQAVFSHNVLGALVESGIKLSPLDKVQPNLNEAVVEEMKIVVTRIEVEEKLVEEKIPFETKEESDANLAWRKKEIKQAGIEGKKAVVYKITYKNGQEIKREKVSQKIIQPPRTEIVSVGTKIKVGQSKVGVASWYAHTGTMACASRMFSQGTWLRVTNRENGKQIFVLVNDYGPMRGTGKMIDLDKVAFEKLAPLDKGVIEVKVEEVIE